MSHVSPSPAVSPGPGLSAPGSGRLRAVLARAVEALVTIVAVLFFFGALLGVLALIFPVGAGIRDLIGTGPAAEEIVSPEGNPRQLVADGVTAEAPVARLSEAEHDVKARRGNSIAWRRAQVGMDLKEADAVQTLRGSRAVIAFDARNRIDLGENSLVIVNKGSRDLFSNGTRSNLTMVDGELRGSFDGSGGEPIELEVIMPTGVTRVTSGSGSGTGSGTKSAELDFRIQVLPDRTSTVTVDKGQAQVSAGGKTVTVGEQQFTNVELDGIPAAPRQLGRGPTLTAPRPNQAYRFRSVSPEVGFSWKSMPGAEAYRFIIARDRFFREVVHDEVLSGTSFEHANLGAGTYFWQVSAMQGGQEITTRRTGRFRVIRDQGPPPLTVDFPAGVIRGDSFFLIGRTDPGMSVTVGKEPVEVRKDGSFRHEVLLIPGLNVVTVEAVDATGNVTYRSEIVNSKP